MKIMIALIMVLAFAVSALALEDTLSLDRCQIVNHSTDQSLPSMLLIHFSLPEGMIGREIILAELTARAALRNVRRDSLLELYFRPFLAQPPEGDADYEEVEGITDSVGVGAWTCRFDTAMSFRVDITEYVRAVATGDRVNYGLIGTVDLLGEGNAVVPENLAGAIGNNARVRIVYK